MNDRLEGAHRANDGMPEKDPVYLGPIIGAIIVLLVLALSALYAWGSSLARAEAAEELSTYAE